VSRRIRTIKPEWLEDELLALASSDARVLSIALILIADDYGNGRANSVQLAGQVFPGKSMEICSNAVAELVRINFVSLYEVDGQRYFSIRNWRKHQKIDRPGKNKVPLPDWLKEELTKVVEKDRDSRGSSPGPGPGPGLSESPPKRVPWKRFPADFVPDESHHKLARELGHNLEYQLELIKDHEFKEAKVDAAATFRTWLRRASTFGGKPLPQSNDASKFREEIKNGRKVIQV